MDWQALNNSKRPPQCSLRWILHDIIAMAESAFINLLSSITEVNAELREQLQTMLKPEIYHHHQVFHVSGQVENRLWYLEQGLLRAYYFDTSGKEHTLHFYLAGEVVFSWSGFYQEAADFYLEALETSHLTSLSYQSLRLLTERFEVAKLICSVFARRRYHLDLFYTRLLTQSAEERYRQFRNLNPEIFRKVSIRLIATYLNMTRENLSKLVSNDHR